MNVDDVLNSGIYKLKLYYVSTCDSGINPMVIPSMVILLFSSKIFLRVNYKHKNPNHNTN